MDIELNIRDIQLVTPRLILRAWNDDDLSDLYEYASVDGVGEMAGWKHHESIDVSKMILDSFISDNDVLAIVSKENNKVIGSLGIHSSWANTDEDYKELKTKDIGYVLSKDYWGKGLVPEAVNEIIRYCFHNIGLDALTISHFTHNLQSKRVIEKCGFQYIKESSYYANQLNMDIVDRTYILFKTQ